MSQSEKPNSLWNHPWLVTIIGGLVVAVVVYFLFPSSNNTAILNPGPSPKTTVDVKSYPFVLPGIHAIGAYSTYKQIERELTDKYVDKDKMSMLDASVAAFKALKPLSETNTLKNILGVSGADRYNVLTIENKGTANDNNVVVTIVGIHLIEGIDHGNHPNIRREDDLIKIKVVRPGDKIFLRVWTKETLAGSDPREKLFRASSNAGIIQVSVH